MSVRRPIRTAQMMALVTGISFGVLGAASASAAAAARTPAPASSACPPDWLGTTTNAEPQISANGRYVVWTGYGDPESGERYIFLRDLKRGRTTVVSDPDAHRYNFLPSISADGNRISYLSRDPLLAGNDAEIWVYDRGTGERTSEGLSFTQQEPALDAHGRHLVFTRLDNGNTNRVLVYTRDVDRDEETLVSANPAGAPANGTSVEPEISSDGRTVLFRSYATDLTEDTVGAQGALFVWNARTNVLTMIPDRGNQGYLERGVGRLSPDGRFVAYGDRDGSWRYDRATGAVRPISATLGVADLGLKGRTVLAVSAGALYVKTVSTGKRVQVDLRPDGTASPSGPGYPGAMTPSGRYVTFYSLAKKLDASEKAEATVNVYRRDLKARTTRLVSTTDAGGHCS